VCERESVCVREKERERECVCVCEREREGGCRCHVGNPEAGLIVARRVYITGEVLWWPCPPPHRVKLQPWTLNPEP